MIPVFAPGGIVDLHGHGSTLAVSLAAFKATTQFPLTVVCRGSYQTRDAATRVDVLWKKCRHPQRADNCCFPESRAVTPCRPRASPLGVAGTEILGHELHSATVLWSGDKPLAERRDAGLPVAESGARLGQRQPFPLY